MKNIFWRLGRRIKKWDDRLLMWSVILVIVVSLILSVLAVVYEDITVNVSDRPFLSECATVVLFAAMLSVAVILGALKQKTFYDNLENRQLLARMIIDNAWYETDLRSNNKGEQNAVYLPRLYYWRRKSITYFPRMYYRKRGGKIYVTVKISMGRYQEPFLHLETKIETGLSCEVISADYRHKWKYYVFLCDVEKNRVNVDQMQVQDGKIRFMNHILWDYNSHPHALIVGDTGSGKSSFLLSIIETLLDIKAKLFIVDAKNAGLAGLEMILPDVFFDPEDIRECMYRFYDAMMDRMEEMRKRPDYTPMSDYRNFDMAPNFLVFDEYVAYMEMRSKKEWEEDISVLKKIILLGRQAGFFVILTCQRPDAKYMPDGIRDQFGLRVALGRMESSGYTMMFGSTDKSFVENETKGYGYVKLWNGVITKFYAPYVPLDHDFIANIRAKSEHIPVVKSSILPTEPMQELATEPMQELATGLAELLEEPPADRSFPETEEK